MLSIEESQEMMEKFIALRNKAKDSGEVEDKKAFRSYERMCIEKFQYLVTMRTNKYRSFSNYNDLNQEGLEALVKSMKNYNLKKGLFFWWAHKYISTRISRSANLHTTIRYPLKVANEHVPHKETIMPILVEKKRCPDKELETCESCEILHEVLDFLNEEQNMIINLAFGLDGDKPMSINKICQKLNISRSVCIKAINNSLSIMRENINI